MKKTIIVAIFIFQNILFAGSPFSFSLKENQNDVCMVEYLSSPGKLSIGKVYIKNAPITFYIDKIDFTQEKIRLFNLENNLVRWGRQLELRGTQLPDSTYGDGNSQSAILIRNYNAEVVKQKHAMQDLETAKSNLRMAIENASQNKPYNHTIKCFGNSTTNKVNGIPQWVVLKVLK